MASFFGKRKEGQDFIAIFDIGSASIAGAFVLLDEKKPPEVIFSTREPIPFQRELNFQRFFNAMLKTLELVFVNMKKAGGEVAIDHAFCVLASPWYASQTRLISFRPEKKPFLVTEKLTQELIEKEILAFRSSKLFESSKIDNALPEIMEVKNIQMKLNGYETNRPFGMHSADMNIALFLSMIPPNILASIQHSITKFWNVKKVHLNSFSYVAYDTLRDLFPKESTYLFIDISGELTDVSLVKDGVLTESLSFPVGKNMLIRALAQGKKSDPEIAASELALYLDEAGTDEHNEKVDELMDKARKEWLAFFEDGLAKFAEDFPIPPLVFYTSDEDIAAWYGKRISEARFNTFTIQEGEFTVKFLGASFLGSLISIQEPLYRDSFIAMEAVFAKKLISIFRKSS